MLQQRPQILEIDEQKPRLVGDLEGDVEDPLLRLVELEKPRQQQRPHIADRRADRMALLAEEIPEGDRKIIRRVSYAQLSRAPDESGLCFAGHADAGEVPFHIGRENSRSRARKPFRQQLQGDGLAGSGRARDETVPVAERQKQIFDSARLCRQGCGQARRRGHPERRRGRQASLAMRRFPESRELRWRIDAKWYRIQNSRGLSQCKSRRSRGADWRPMSRPFPFGAMVPPPRNRMTRAMNAALEPLTIAVLDDYQNVALAMADWSQLADRAIITVFNDHVADPEALVARLAPFDVLCVMRERTPLPRAIIEQLPRLKLIVSTGRRNAAIDVAAAAERGIPIAATGLRLNADDRTHLGADPRQRAPHRRRKRVASGGGWQRGIGVDLVAKRWACSASEISARRLPASALPSA